MVLHDRPKWSAKAPPGGWAPPWQQCIELAQAIPSAEWTLVGGLMVQLHAAVAGVAITRSTADVDIVVHVETGATTLRNMERKLADLGYVVSQSVDADAPAHRFVRGVEQLDVMIADHVAPRVQQKIAGRFPFRIPGGTQALKRTVDCMVELSNESSVTISIPNHLGALVLKGAAFLEDSRDRDRHLEDAAVLAVCATDPRAMAREMGGHDRSRVMALNNRLKDPAHPAWLLIDRDSRIFGQDVLNILVANHNFP